VPEYLLWVGINPEMADLLYAVTVDMLSKYFEKVGDGKFKLKDNVYLKLRRDEIQIYVCENEYVCP
jgi:hypothetical protein